MMGEPKKFEVILHWQFCLGMGYDKYEPCVYAHLGPLTFIWRL